MYSSSISLALSASFLWALYPFLLKPLQTDGTTIWMTMSMITTFLICLSLLALPNYMDHLFSMDRKTFLTLAIASILGPVLGVLLYMKALKASKRIAPTVAIAFTSPVFALLIGYVFFNEKIALMELIGIIMVVVGILLIQLFRQT